MCSGLILSGCYLGKRSPGTNRGHVSQRLQEPCGMGTSPPLVGRALIWDCSSGSCHPPAEKGQAVLEIQVFADKAQIKSLNICSVGNSDS